MKGFAKVLLLLIAALFIASPAFSAYEHEGEQDSPKFLSAYPGTVGTKLDHCATCHTGGQVEQSGKLVSIGSCQWCHTTYGYDGSGNIVETLNAYGLAYLLNGRNEAALTAIEGSDSDEDGFTNKVEIDSIHYPGNANDDPSKIPAPSMVFSLADLQAMPQHTQFLLMNTSRSGDYYAQYSGVVVEDLLNAAGKLPSATGINVYAPDGYSNYHPMTEDPSPSLYHVIGTYLPSVYYYDEEADQAITDYGWCDYSAPSTAGRNPNDLIVNPDGLKMILAYLRDGVELTTGVLDDTNRLDGEGPFRVVPPQKVPSPPDQSSKSDIQDVIWPYNNDWDHNAGFSSRSATIIKVEPLPEGTTDVDILEAGWNYVDEGKILIYGAIAWQPDARTGWYYTAGKDGTGVSIEIQNGVLFMAWYAYENGQPVWYTADGLMSDANTFSGQLYKWTGWPLGQTPGEFSRTPVGTVGLTFTDATSAELAWTFNGAEDTKSLVRFMNDKYGGASDSRNINGWWYEEAYDGMGFFIESYGGQIFIAWYHYQEDGTPRWWSTGGPFAAGATSFSGSLLQWSGGECIGCAYTAPESQAMEAVSLTFNSDNTITMVWGETTFTLHRFQFGNMQ